MSTGRKAFSNPRAIPRYRGEFGAWRPSTGKLPAVLLGLAVGITGCAAIAGSLPLETQPQQIVAPAPTPRSIIEARFFIAAAPAIDSARQRPSQAADTCDDLAFRFLNTERCTDAHSKHVAQTGRAATVVIAHSGAASPDLSQSQVCEAGLKDRRQHCTLD